MKNTTQMLRSKSEAFKKTVQTALDQLKSVNNEIVAQMQINENSATQKNNEINQLRKDNEELVALKTDNEDFISKVEEIIVK